MTLTPGTRVGPYEVVSAIGAGGMGEVYRARDPRLGRDVALKVLPAPFAADPDRLRRLEQEARAASALNHPNVLTIFDVGHIDGELFVASEFVAGETLRARLTRGLIPVEDVVTLAAQIAAGLAAAHEAGIVHCDLKPENVMIRPDGLVKLLDFGLAKAIAVVEIDGEVTLPAATGIGLIGGTVKYMSPEQARGQQVDARSDVFSFGVVLYELLAGCLPHDGPTATDVMVAILDRVPPPLAKHRAGVPLHLQQVVSRCLEKKAEHRYGSAGELAQTLRSATSDIAAGIAPLSSARADPSIAVLPFVNLSSDPENEYFAEGLAEEIISDLSAIRALRVISRASAMRFKSADPHFPTIAGELGVRYVLQGSVRRAGQSLRITAQLIDAQQDTNIWAEKYGARLDDVFAIQEEISRRIVTALKLRLSPSEDRQIAAKPLLDLRAYDCYLRARQELYRWTPESLQRAEELVGSALDIVGENALLHATEGYIHWMHVNSGITPEEGRLVRAEDCARRALALEPESYQGIFVRGIVAALRGRLEDGVQDLMTAHQRNPGDASVLIELSRFLFDAGQVEAFRQATATLIRIDPLTPVNWLAQILVHTSAGQFNDAVATARKMQRLLEPFSPVWIHLAWQGLLPAGHEDEAHTILREYRARVPHGMYQSLAGFLLAAIECDVDGGCQAFTPAIEAAATWQEHLARIVADAYARLGDTDRALRWLSASIGRGFINWPFLAEHDFLLAPIRNDPRFKELMVGIRRRWEVFPAVMLPT